MRINEITYVELQGTDKTQNFVAAFPSFLWDGHRCEAEGYQKIVGVMEVGRTKLG